MDAVDVAGLRITYRRAGSGPELFLLHGAFEDSRAWGPELARFAAYADVIAWDAPGCGGSADVPETWEDRDWADAVAGFIAALGLRRPVLLGLSLGSVLALVAARDHPSAIGGLVLVGAYAGWAGSRDPGALAERIRPAEATIETPVDEWAESFLDSVYAPGSDPRRRELTRSLLADWRPSTTRVLLRTLSLDLREALPAINVPTLVVRGSEDARSPRSASLAIVAAMPDARFAEIDGAGHDCAGPELAARVAAFLADRR
ncbi:alpha/beta fold hydrolase [Agromyces sp. Marseille-P2726]|uniref:alpha/beta fold hydrolase n=1 Tax=Agromyces sp. Marseille-P2726 TaxID=2709132 RepID=UPI0015712020|nr:alpha/beta hydrolase [Agromyces sp. Marseille-P2726]